MSLARATSFVFWYSASARNASRCPTFGCGRRGFSVSIKRSGNDNEAISGMAGTRPPRKCQLLYMGWYAKYIDALERRGANSIIEGVPGVQRAVAQKLERLSVQLIGPGGGHNVDLPSRPF